MGSRPIRCIGGANSTALLLNSVNDQHPAGLGNSSGLLGRNYMVHNSTFFMAVNPACNQTAWQKTLGLNDWYEAVPGCLGNLQMLGKLQARWSRPPGLGCRCGHSRWSPTGSLDIYLTTEDLPIRTTGSPSTATRS